MNDHSTALAKAPLVTPAAAATAQAGHHHYAVWLLSSVYMLNMLDRTLLSPLVEPIKQEFRLSDSQMGLLGGLAFGLFYAVITLLLARLSDRGNRVNVISVSITIWSVFTALSGMAVGFWSLLMARAGVGIGEAGCNPAAYSIISDYFVAKKRATALAIYHAGGAVGVFAGFLIAGLVLEHYTWRYAFFIVGIPGLLLALIVKLTLREPRRGMSDKTEVAAAPPPVMQVLTQLLRKPAFRNMAIGCALTNTVVFGIGGFISSYLIRSHAVTPSDSAYLLAFITLAGGIFGTFLCGMLSDFLANRSQDRRYYLWVPGAAMLLYFPIAQVTYATQNQMVAIVGIALTQICMVVYLSPCLSALYGMVGIRERALASALLLFILNLFGIGFGPYVAGLISDFVNAQLAGQGMDSTLATAEGLRWSLRGMTVLGVLGGIMFFLSARTLSRDSVKVE